MKILKQVVAATLLVVAVGGAQAASPQKEIVTRSYSATIHCESCKAKIMKTLPFKKGVKYVDVDMSKQEITVKYDSSKSSDEEVVKALKSVNVEATPKS